MGVIARLTQAYMLVTCLSEIRHQTLPLGASRKLGQRRQDNDGDDQLQSSNAKRNLNRSLLVKFDAVAWPLVTFYFQRIDIL